MKQTQELNQRGIIIVSGIPGSGKSYFAKKLCQKLRSNNHDPKIFSTDNLQAFFYENPNASAQETHQIFSRKDWDNFLRKYQLNKQNFDEKAWNISRKMIENPQILDLLLGSCQALIIEDQLALRSQRKAFKRYCFEQELKYMEIQIQVTLQQALLNNEQRGKHFPQQKVSQQVIKKSFSKYEHNQNSIVLTRSQTQQFLSSFDINPLMKYVKIEDNYSEYLLKKSVQHEFTEKELDENGLRKLISLIMKDETESKRYFHGYIQSKEKAAILAQSKKLYLEKKRKVPFVDILSDLINKEK